jgi:hypothetical protein
MKVIIFIFFITFSSFISAGDVCSSQSMVNVVSFCKHSDKVTNQEIVVFCSDIISVSASCKSTYKEYTIKQLEQMAYSLASLWFFAFTFKAMRTAI